jgi:tetratricopeptide (TPR) repeat protein
MSHLKPFERIELKNLLNTLFGNVRYADSVSKIQSGLNIDSSLLALGAQLEEDKEYATAIRILRFCIDTNPGTVFAYIRLGVCYYALKDKFKAQLCMAHASILFMRYEKHLIASASGDDTHISLIPMVQAMFAGDYQAVPSDVTISSDISKIMYNLGCTSLKYKYLPGAEICQRLAVEMDPSHVNALANLGSCLCEQQRFAEAVPFLMKSLHLMPRDEITLLGLSFAFLLLDYPYFASFCAARVLELKPNYSKAQKILFLAESSSEIIDLKEGMKNYWGLSRLSALVLNLEARTNIGGMQSDVGDIPNGRCHIASLVRSFAASVEKETKVLLMDAVDNKMGQNYSTENKRQLTLGAMPSYFSQKFTNFITLKTQNTSGYQPDVAAFIKKLFHLNNDDVQTISDCLGTIAFVRNVAAHGDEVNVRFDYFVDLIRTVLLIVTKARLNWIVDSPAPFSWRSTPDGQIYMIK